MQQQLYEQGIIKFLQENILAENIHITNTTKLREVGIDSYSIVEIILFIERKYNYVMPDHLLKSEHFVSVEKIASVLAENIK